MSYLVFFVDTFHDICLGTLSILGDFGFSFVELFRTILVVLGSLFDLCPLPPSRAGISIEDRCTPCWLSHALLSCTLPSLMHDRLRKRLPQYLKEKIPTSLARSVYVTNDDTTTYDIAASCGGVPQGSHASNNNNKLPSTTAPDSLPGLFGSVMERGWKRGAEAPVNISSAGDKLKSIPKLEEHFAGQGIHSDARVLFGAAAGGGGGVTSAAVSLPSSDILEDSTKPRKKKKKKKKKKHRTRDCSPDGSWVTTTLPGGWVRRTNFTSSSTRTKLHIHVSSPDGRTFKSRKQLSAYFHQIGRVDDILKYFPLFHDRGGGAHVDTSSERTGGEGEESSTEPGLSSEQMWSDEVTSRDLVPLSVANCGAAAGKLNNNDKLNIFASEDTSPEDFVTFDTESIIPKVGNNYINRIDKDDPGKGISVSPKSPEEGVRPSISPKSGSPHGESPKRCDTNFRGSEPRPKRASISIQLPSMEAVEVPPEVYRTLEEAYALEHQAASTASSTSSSCDTFVSPLTSRRIKKKKKKEKHSSRKTKSSPSGPSFTGFKSATVPSYVTVVPPLRRGGGGTSSCAPVSADSMELERCPSPDSQLVLSPKAKVKAVSKATPAPPPPLLKAFQTQHLGGGWSRKIKWNAQGIGKVSLVVTPSGTRIQSNMELQGYLKKEGTPVATASIYFPQQLLRADVPVPVIRSTRTPKSAGGGSKAAADKARAALQHQQGTPASGSSSSHQVSQTQSAGPRIKRVCRSLEQVRGGVRFVPWR